LYQIEKSQEEI
jgi:hypothetical protein